MDFRIAVASLNQWALDFDGNTRRIIKSIEDAISAKAIYRTGPELELCGYSLEDAFFEGDTTYHCWQCLCKILDRYKDDPIILDIGMPVSFSGSLYNCRVICNMGRVLCIRAKTSLAKEGNYREFRHFNAWPRSAGLVPFELPGYMPDNVGRFVPFGADFVLDLKASIDRSQPKLSSLRIGWEVCQELWDSDNVSSDLYGKYGCHLVVNSSGSYWELRKLDTISNMIKGISLRAGACYAYSNLYGCDGQRYVFSGMSCIYDGGVLKDMMQVDSRSMIQESHLILYDVSPAEIEQRRAQMGIRPKNACHKVFDLTRAQEDILKLDNQHKVLHLDLGCPRGIPPTQTAIRPHCVPKALPKIEFHDEIRTYVSLWLWDYLRRSGMKGFMMPLSGGLDSSTVAMLVFEMCKYLYEIHVYAGSAIISDYFKRYHGMEQVQFDSPRSICRLLLKCVYISTNYSSQATESRAQRLSESIGAEFSVISIQDIYTKCRQVDLGDRPPDVVTLLDQNLQARLRMTMTYYLSGGDRIVLATGNVDEAIMGYLTKYDCSSADINPIGGLCKEDLKNYLKSCCHEFHPASLVSVLKEIIDAPPSAELTGSEQRDEDEIGITYDEISVLGKVRRGIYGSCGPVGAFECVWRNRTGEPFSTNLRCIRDNRGDPKKAALELGELIKRFYRRYMRNRHKLTVLTPALHAETYSPDDNRFDHRQFLYPQMDEQFASIDELVKKISLSK